MTAKEALETIRMAIAEVEWEYPMEYAAAFEMAIEALAKELDCADKPHLDWTLREVATHCARHLRLHDYRRTSSTKVVSAGDRLYMNGFEWTGQEWRRSLRAVLLTGWCE